MQPVVHKFSLEHSGCLFCIPSSHAKLFVLSGSLSLPSSLCLFLLSFFPHHWQHARARTCLCLSSCPQVSLCCSPPGETPAAKQTPGSNCSQIPGWWMPVAERGKEYLKRNASNATHPRLILSYPRLNSLKHVSNKQTQTDFPSWEI